MSLIEWLYLQLPLKRYTTETQRAQRGREESVSPSSSVFSVPLWFQSFLQRQDDFPETREMGLRRCFAVLRRRLLAMTARWVADQFASANHAFPTSPSYLQKIRPHHPLPFHLHLPTFGETEIAPSCTRKLFAHVDVAGFSVALHPRCRVHRVAP